MVTDDAQLSLKFLKKMKKPLLAQVRGKRTLESVAIYDGDDEGGPP